MNVLNVELKEFLTLDRMCRVEICLLYKVTYSTTIATTSIPCCSVQFVVDIGDQLNEYINMWCS